MINKDRLRLGIEALRSGRFLQGREALKRETSPSRTVYCCLGVLTEVALQNGLIDEYDNFWNSTDGDLALVVVEWYGFGDVDDPTDPLLNFGESEDCSAIEASDVKKYSFLKIAKAFEKLIEND